VCETESKILKQRERDIDKQLERENKRKRMR
jgi:hypothetical protein